MTESAKKEINMAECYVPSEERVLDPSLIDKSILDRLPSPSGWRILILPFRPPNKTAGGILLSNKTVDENQVQTVAGYVLKVGPLAYQDKEKFPFGAWCKEKDWVIFARYAGSRFRLNDDSDAAFGSEVRILNDDEVLGTILDPNDLFHN
uniref:Co-chaperonin GroES n=1 Tax=uncultured virus TaxID=340016 RepID=A0A221S2N6_9VIRU|nr:co-chaperonin GroES [uncultured virus]ASN63181.1 co-chaperonin GroES [uncultured virus]